MEEELFSISDYVIKESIAGCDEAGRGPLAGPVVAACVVLPEDFPYEVLADSKVLDEKSRQQAEEIIKQRATAWAVTSLSHKVIDEINILQASLRAMKLSLEKVRKRIKVDKVLVDGNRSFDSDIPVIPIVKGDAKIPEIMAASILAKQERDRIMDLCDRKWPQYEYGRHKGYPTRRHIELIRMHGDSPIARRTFHLKKDEKKEEDSTPLL